MTLSLTGISGLSALAVNIAFFIFVKCLQRKFPVGFFRHLNASKKLCWAYKIGDRRHEKNKDILFPILNVVGNKIKSIDGNISHFYKLTPPDLEQMEFPFLFFSFIKDWVNGFEGYGKIYSLDGKTYLDTDSVSDTSFLSSEEEPLKNFFGSGEIVSDMNFFEDYLVFNGQYHRIISVLDFPDSVIDENFLPLGVDYVLCVKRLSKEKSIKKLEYIRTKNLAVFEKVKRDVASESSYEQAEELLDDIIHEREHLFEMELFFILRDDSLEGINVKTKQLVSHLSTKGVKTFIEGQSLIKGKSGLSHVFCDLIPGVRPKLSLRVNLTKTSHLLCLLPLHNSFLMKDGIRFHDKWGDSIFFNPFSKELKNRNLLITGTTGSGKSVLANKLIHELVDDHPTVILDKGGSFKRTTLYHGGEVMRVGFNPMQFKNPLYLREFILSVVDNFSKQERGKLLLLLKEHMGKTDDFLKLLNLLEKDFKGISLYFEDIKDFFTQETIDINKSILYVDLNDYPKPMVSPLIIFLLEFFKNIPVKEKILVFDECWSFLKNHASYIEECFRTFRKTGAFPIAISQSLRDFHGS